MSYPRFIENVLANDLDGRIDVSALSDILGQGEKRIYSKLKQLKRLCMQGFRIHRDGEKLCIELESKKIKCFCKNCGGELEKKLYFHGICPYCGSLDIFAQVIAGDELYSIQHVENESAESYFYITGDADEAVLNKEIIMCLIHAGLALMNFILGYLGVRSVVEGERELSLPITFLVFVVVFLYYMVQHYRTFIYIATVRRFSEDAADVKEPFLATRAIYVESLRNRYNVLVSTLKDSSDKKKLKVFREIQKRGYSRN